VVTADRIIDGARSIAEPCMARMLRGRPTFAPDDRFPCPPRHVVAHRPASLLPALVLLALVTSACGREAETRTAAAAYAPNHHLAADYPAEFRAGETVLPRGLIARGDSLYHGVIGQANCILCHGPFLSGGSHGTNLRDQRWHHGDGSYEFIVRVATHGVGAVQSPISRMPPMGGVPLSEEEIRALAAYVYWFSNTRAASDAVSGHDGQGHDHSG
jgi:mono/diheme cytochrome c family protein